MDKKKNAYSKTYTYRLIVYSCMYTVLAYFPSFDTVQKEKELIIFYTNSYYAYLDFEPYRFGFSLKKKKKNDYFSKQI